MYKYYLRALAGLITVAFMCSPPAFAQSSNMEGSLIVDCDADEDDDIPFGDIVADFEFVAVAFVPVDEHSGQSPLAVPSCVQLPARTLSSMPQLGTVDEWLAKLASGSSFLSSS